MSKRKVLFLCTGNACRSQMAEGWLKYLAGDIYDVYSAGIVAHGKNPRAIAAMKQAGVDVSQQKSEALDPVLLADIDLLITVCGNADASCPTVPVSCEKQHWPFDDPAKASGSEEEIMAEFYKVRDKIRQQIQVFLQGA
ncbi:arsenate reductase (thioredoxin) [Ghiorsea bivora]|uniref:arsenate reductase (thioredoxin) n=1 Tax=Ghiorsea bivora TaxID=1485545 RepID=UPI00056F84DE|nr:arsenate reductase (thioredoxin) [Ghiorsea bivora]